jgi:hypothetical protein
MGVPVTGLPENDPLLEAVILDQAELRAKIGDLEAVQAADREMLEKTLAALANKQAARGYQPCPAPRWWQLEGDERAQAVDRLRNWVATVYRPGYGHLGIALRPCWTEHDLCLYLLDFLSELHAVLYQSRRTADGEVLSRSPGTLTSAAEWHIRLLPAAVSLMDAETKRCEHAVEAEARR